MDKSGDIKKDDMDLENEINELFFNRDYERIVFRAYSLFGSGDIPSNIKQNIALSYFHRKNYDRSLVLFKEIASEKDDIESWFNVLMAMVMSNRSQEGKKVFSKIIEMCKSADSMGGEMETAPRPGIPFIVYNYACALNEARRYDDALEQLEELKNIYIQLNITDSTFLYIRGVPFLSNVLNLAKEVFKGLGKNLSDSDLLKELKDGIDDDGKALIERYYE